MANRKLIDLQVGTHGRDTIMWELDGTWIERVTDIHIHAQAGQLTKGYYLQDVIDENGEFVKTRRGIKRRKVFFIVNEIVNGHPPMDEEEGD